MLAAALALGLLPASLGGTSSEAIVIRGRTQTLRVYDGGGGANVVVLSGDGGWTHLAPDVAVFLSGRGYRIFGLDSKAYLSSFTAKGVTLTTSDVPSDLAQVVAYASRGSSERTLLVGISEGAGLALLAATEDRVKPAIQGVIALGLPDKAELGWRFRDSIIYVTKGLPDEPLFDIAEFAPRVAPVPLVAIHATRDEFTPVDHVKGVMERAAEPKRLRILEAANHRFSDNQAGLQKELLDSIQWIQEQRR